MLSGMGEGVQALGGRGIKDLKLYGLEHRTRWERLQRTDPNRPWEGLPLLQNANTYEIFQSLVKFKAGDGKNMLLWKCILINGRSADEYIAREIYRTVKIKM